MWWNAVTISHICDTCDTNVTIRDVAAKATAHYCPIGFGTTNGIFCVRLGGNISHRDIRVTGVADVTEFHHMNSVRSNQWYSLYYRIYPVLHLTFVMIPKSDRCGKIDRSRRLLGVTRRNFCQRIGQPCSGSRPKRSSVDPEAKKLSRFPRVRFFWHSTVPG